MFCFVCFCFKLELIFCALTSKSCVLIILIAFCYTKSYTFVFLCRHCVFVNVFEETIQTE